MKLFPKEKDFFVIFDKAATNLVKATSLLVSLLENFDNIETRAKEIYEVEQDGDILTHDIMKHLNSTFLTPIDREDIHCLASRIDDVLDLVWGAVDRLVVFKIETSTKEVISIAKSLHETTQVIHKTIKELKSKNYSHVQEHCIEINRLENHIDRTFRDALGKLFDDVKDPITIIKWKEIYEHLEEAADKCEDVANILESIVLKHA
jgi:predicted phosphate transport protein (TIGR00153 family)